MAKKKGQLNQLLPVIEITINNDPQTFMQSPLRYERLDFVFVSHRGLVSLPKPTHILDCEFAEYVGSDLVLIKQGTYRLYSLSQNRVVYDTGQSDLTAWQLVNNVCFVFSTPTLGRAVVWTVGYTGFQEHDYADIQNVREILVYQGRLFLVKERTIQFSTSDFYGDVSSGQDPFDFNRGAGFVIIDHPYAVGNPKGYVSSDVLYLFYPKLLVLATIRTTANLSLNLSYYNFDIGEVKKVLPLYPLMFISHTGLYQLRGTRAELITLGLTGIAEEGYEGGGYCGYAGQRFIVIAPKNKSYSLLFSQELKTITTYPQNLKEAFTYGNASYGFDGSSLYKLFDSTTFYPFYLKATYSNPSNFIFREGFLHGTFTTASMKINGENMQIRRVRADYTRFFYAKPKRLRQATIEITAENAVTEKVIIKGHGGRPTF